MATTTERGLGWQHQKQRDRLLKAHTDGSPCYWCNRPMFRLASNNWDGNPLEADHSQARSRGGATADRLLHKRCNASRQDGSRDHQRPALRERPRPQAFPWPELPKAADLQQR